MSDFIDIKSERIDVGRNDSFSVRAALFPRETRRGVEDREEWVIVVRGRKLLLVNWKRDLRSKRGVWHECFDLDTAETVWIRWNV